VYDIIGDIHGKADELEALLATLGYVRSGTCFRHESRKAIFVGDFIDRGPFQRRVIDLVREMVHSGAAKAVMGNHEFNAIGYYTPDSRGGFLRPRNCKNTMQHRAFLNEFESQPEFWREATEWFKSLPLWIEFDGLRIVHACWDPALIKRLTDNYGECALLTDDLLHEASRRGTWQYQAVETLLKGKEISLPESALTHIPDDPIQGNHMIEYGHDEKPVFIGHYWMEGSPAPLAKNIACLDYSVAKPGGKLVAYRWNGEAEIMAGNYVWVDCH
jgi:hypothetical protein